jgi:hypothetical protein
VHYSDLQVAVEAERLSDLSAAVVEEAELERRGSLMASLEQQTEAAEEEEERG